MEGLVRSIDCPNCTDVTGIVAVKVKVWVKNTAHTHEKATMNTEYKAGDRIQRIHRFEVSKSIP